MLRSGAAISGADRPAVATWYRSGWNTWWLRRSRSVTSTGARARARAARRPAKPPPAITTCGRLLAMPASDCIPRPSARRGTEVASDPRRRAAACAPRARWVDSRHEHLQEEGGRRGAPTRPRVNDDSGAVRTSGSTARTRGRRRAPPASRGKGAPASRGPRVHDQRRHVRTAPARAPRRAEGGRGGQPGVRRGDAERLRDGGPQPLLRDTGNAVGGGRPLLRALGGQPPEIGR